jgi:hypothetical protein
MSDPVIDGGGIIVSHEKGPARIELQPERLYRRAKILEFREPVREYLVRLRVYDREQRRRERHITPEGAPNDRALDRECRERRDASLAIKVPAGMRLVVSCPQALLDGEGVLVKVGVPHAGSVDFDESMAIARPAFAWWIEAVPGWLADGWRLRPWPPIALAALFFAIAAFLRWGPRRADPEASRVRRIIFDHPEVNP